MKRKNSLIKRITSFVLLTAIGINTFGSSVPYGMKKVYATEYEEVMTETDEAATEEMEEEPVKQRTAYESLTISSETTLKADMEVDNLTVNNKLHLNGHKVVVHGDVVSNSGIYMEEGYLEIAGNYSELYYATLEMQSVNDYILIHNNFIYTSNYSNITRKVNKGTIEIKGNIYGSNGNYCEQEVIYGEACKILLSGTMKQEIDIRTDSHYKPNQIVIENTSEEGVFSKHLLQSTNITDENGKLHYPAEGEIGETLEDDMVIEGNYTLLGGTLNLDGHNLTIKGDFIHAAGNVDIHGGNLIVEGDYRKQYIYQKDEETVYELSIGRLFMKDESDYFLIKGDYIDSGLYSTDGDFTNGTLELKGNLSADNTLKHALFTAKDKHTFKLTGDEKQILETGKQYSGSCLQFADFIVEQGENGSTELTSEILVTSSVAHQSDKINGTTRLVGAAIHSENLYGDIQIQSNYKFDKDVVIHGGLTLRDYTTTIENCHVSVTGDFRLYKEALSITGESGLLSVDKDFYVGFNVWGNKFTSGVMELCGNIITTDSGQITCSESTEIRFIGNSVQKIELPNSNSVFANVLIDNEEGVIISKGVTLLNANCKKGVISYASGGIHGFTVEEDGEYNGDLIIAGGTLDLNGHTFHVKGNLTIENGSLNMRNAEDALIVDGNFKTTSTIDHNGKLTDGTLEVKGDFIQEGNVHSFDATGNHTTVLNGNKKQTVRFSNLNYSRFINLTLDNSEGVVFSWDAKATGVVKQNQTTVDGYLRINADTSFEDKGYKGNIKISEYTVLKHDLIIDGELWLDRDVRALWLGGHRVEVTGKVLLEYSGDVYINQGYLECDSFEIGAYASLTMNHPNDQVIIHNDLIINSYYNFFSNGYLTVGGDVTFVEGKGSLYSKDFKLELNGTSKQTVTMNGSICSFGTLILNNPSEEGIYVTRDLAYAEIDNSSGTKVTFADGGSIGFDLEEDRVIDGDFHMSGGELNLNGHQLTIKGNLIQSGGETIINNGSLLVEGDYYLAKCIQTEDGVYECSVAASKLNMQNESDTVTVKGNFYTAANQSVYNAGTLNLNGNLKVINSNFYLGSDFNIVFNGEEEQLLTFNDGQVRFGRFCVQNKKGIKCTNGTGLPLYGRLEADDNPIGGLIKVYANNVIQEDTINGNLEFDISVSLTKDLHVKGNMNFKNLNLNNHHLTIDGNCYLSNLLSEMVYQNNGILELKGNLITSTSTNEYKCSGSNQFVFSGDKKQTIQIFNINLSLNELVIKNTSAEGVYAESLFNVNCVSDPEHKLSFYTEGETGYTLTKDTVIQGDFTLLAGIMDLNGYKLTVTGNLLHKNGSIDIHGGTLEVYGNYTLGNPDANGYYQKQTAKLFMDNEEDSVLVHKNVILSPSLSLDSCLTAGIMEMKDNFIYQYNGQGLNIGSALHMVFSGDKKQSLIDTSDACKVYPGTLDIQNTSNEGVVAVNNLTVKAPVIGNGNISGTEDKTLYWNYAGGLPFDKWSGNLVMSSEIKLTDDLTVDGMLTCLAPFDLNGHHVTANNIENKTSVTMNGGILQVKSNYNQTDSKANLIMAKAEDTVQVTGNVKASTGALDLTAGKLDIKGNVEISDVNLTASGTHTTTLSGKTTSKGTAYIQTITINNGVFNKLVLTKPREYYVFNRAAEDLCAELIDDVQDITAPSVPKGLSASDIGYTGLKLSWQESTDDTGIAGYDIYRNGKKIMSVSGTSFVDKNLAPGTEYTYYVTAKDEVLNTSAISEKISVLTLADTKAPEIPTGIELLERNGHSLAFRWNPSKDNVKTCGYTVYRNGEKLETVQGTEYTDNGLTENSHYTYSISAYDADGNESEASEEVNFYTQAVEVAEFTPAEYGKISGKSTELKLDFMNAGSKNGYRVFIGYREKGQENYKELISGMKGVGTAYRKMISVKAELDTESITAEEIEVLIRITDASGYEVTEHYTYYLDKAAPSKMEEVRAEAADGVAFISYAKGTEADIRGYYIYREEEGKERERIADITDKDKTYYYDKTILDGVNYNYYVSAYDEEGYEGELSDAVNVQGNKDESMPVIRGVEPISGVLCGRAKLLVTAEDNKSLDKVLLEVYQKETDSYVSMEEKSIEDGKAELYFDTNGFKNEVTLRFTVWDKAGNQNEGPFERTYVTDNEGPASVKHLDAEVISTTVVLSWDAPAEEDFSYFVVEERMEEEWREAARTTTVTGYVFEGLIPQSTHVYRVTAYDIYGNKGVPSEELSVTVNEDTICPRITSVKPNGGYYKESIPLTVKAYDNIALANLIMEYSYDKENWNVCYETSFEKERKEETVYYELSLEDMEEGDIYIRAYAEDTAGNAGDKEQVLLQCKVDKTAPEKIAKLTAAGEAGSIMLSWNEPTDNDVAGYKIYRSMEGVNAYKIIASSVKALGFYDDGAVYDAVYSYKVTAYDYAGNESELSNAVTAQKLPDDMIPSVHSLSPENDSWVSGEKELSAYVSDNDMVSTVEFAIKNADEDAVKMILDTVSVKQKAGTAVCPLDTTEYENGVYTLYVTAKDAAGNISKTYESVLHICNVVMEVPELTGLPGNWCSLLSYNGSPEYTYVLYCRELSEESFRTVWSGTGSLLYKDNNVNPKYTYVYQLLIQDKAGNVNYSPLVYVKPNPVDDRCPTAVITAGTSVVEGYEVVFNGIESSDNDKIAEYLWDFGDGTEPSSNPAPVHKYEKAGNYNVTLTVKDPAGNTDDTTIKVTVLPKNDAGKAVIEVRNIYGTPLKGVSVYVNTSAEHNDTAYTDKNGRAAVMQRPGTYRVALYKPGYVAEEKEIEIELHGDSNYVFTIAEGETISADFKVRQLSFEEIVAAGIDINAPENQHVFTVETTLSFSDMNRVESYTEEVNMTPANSVVNKASNGAYVPPKKPQDEKPGGGSQKPPVTEEIQEEQSLADLYYTIYITQSISWLKDMYQATLIVYNNASSQTIVAKDLTTQLVLPSGVSLAGTNAGNEMTQKLKDLHGGESDQVNWYLRGDTPGRYKLSALLNGKLQPFDADLSSRFESNEFDVTAGDGLVLTISPEDRAEKGELYYVYYTLSNDGSKEFYNVKTTFGTSFSNSKRFIGSADGSKRYPVMSAGDCAVVNCLKPGESISGIYKTSLPVEGDKYYNYKELVKYEAKALQGANLGVAVRISPTTSHVPVPELIYQPPEEENTEADPVNVSTGAFTDELSALSVQGVNPVAARLMYDSNAVEEPGEFGYGWSHNYEARILNMKDCTVRYYVSPSGYYTFLAEDYEKAEYKQDKDGYLYLDEKSIPVKQNFKCLNENKGELTLTRNDDGSYTLTDASGSTTQFDKKGNLTSIQNKEGKKITVKREEDGFTVTDSVTKRHLTYTLNKDRFVSSITDDNERTVDFYYDKNGCLKQFTNAAGENTYYTYDKNHRILTITDDDNNTYVTNTYNAEGLVESQEDGLGYKTTFAYEKDEITGSMLTTVKTRSGAAKETLTDAYGNVTKRTNEAGDKTLMTYDSEGNQTSVNNPNGYDVLYRYDENNNMTSVENELMDGGTAETVMRYDADGNMTHMENCNGESMDCTYFSNGLIQSVTDQNGNTTTYTYNGSGQLTKEEDAQKRTIEYTYEKGDLVKVKDKNGNITSYTYNDIGLMETASVTDGSGTYTTTTLYDDMGRVDSVTDAEGGITFYEYDCAGNITTRVDAGGAMTVFQYDKNYQMTKETVYSSEDSSAVTSNTEYSYTKEGLLKKVTDTISHTVIENSYDKTGNKIKEIEKKGDKKLSELHFEYDKAGNCIKQTQVNLDAGATEKDNLTAEYKYYPNGKLNYSIDTAGKKTVYSYDKSWRVQTVVSDISPTVTYTYDKAGHVLTETAGEKEKMTSSYTYDIYGNVKTVTDTKGNTTEYFYDGNGNVTEVMDATHKKNYQVYDALNRVVEVGVQAFDTERIPLVRMSYDIANHTVTKTDAVNGGSITTSYDTAGRPYKTTDKEGNILSETIYDTEGRILQTVDANGLVTENVYNSLMQIEKVRQGAKGTKTGGVYNITGEVRETAYTNDDLGRTTSVTDALQGKSSVVFDSLGRITSMKDPMQNQDAKNGATIYTYNKAGLLLSETNAIGNQTTYQYNDKLLLKEMKDSANETTGYKYDSLNRISEVEDKLGTIRYTYDANGNVTEVTEKEGLFSAGKTILREFDSLNRITKYTDYKGREVNYTYDTLGNLMTLMYPGGEIVRYEYYPDGNVKVMESNSGGTSYYTDYTYDSCGRLKTTERPDGTVESRTYDKAGNLTSQVDKKGNTVLQENHYTYNVFGEVIEKSTSNTVDISVLETVSMTYDSVNRLKTYNDQEVKYDAKGNMIYGPVDGVMQELTYDCRNRLISAGGITYTYDAENTRIASTKDNRTTEYVTDTGGSLSKLLTAYEADGTETEYYYGAEGLSCQYNTGTKKSIFYHFDNIGSTTMITDLAGEVIERFSYGTYGELLTEVKNKIRFLFNGAYGVATDDNGLYYMRARYYNPDIKRFINQDIKTGDIGNSQSLNRYAYCEGNPVSLIDPFGLSPKAAQDQGSEDNWFAHLILGLGGLLVLAATGPVGLAVGIACCVADGLLYAHEGKKTEAVFAFLGAAGGVGKIVGALGKGAAALNASEYICKGVDMLTKMCGAICFGSDALESAGNAKMAKALNGGKVNGEVVKNYVQTAISGTLGAFFAGSLLKDGWNLGKSIVSSVGGVGRYSEKEIKKIIKNIQGDGFKNNPLRQAYESEVAGLKEYGDELLVNGMSEKDVAKILNQARRDLGVKYKNATPQPLRDYIYEINMERYGDKLGPTYEWLVNEKGVTDMDIINSASRPNSNIDRLLSGFEDWLRRQ